MTSFEPQVRRDRRGTKKGETFRPAISPTGISTEFTTANRWITYRDGQQIGHIHEVPGGFQFRARSVPVGEVHPTLDACKASLEA